MSRRYLAMRCMRAFFAWFFSLKLCRWRIKSEPAGRVTLVKIFCCLKLRAFAEPLPPVVWRRRELFFGVGGVLIAFVCLILQTIFPAITS